MLTSKLAHMTEFSTPHELAVREAPAPLAPAVTSSFGLPDNFVDQMRLAEVVAKSDLVDKKLQGKPENVFMVVQKAIGLNISFDLAVAKTHVIDNKVTPSAELLRILLRRAGHDLEIFEHNDKVAKARLTLAHRPSKPITMEFTLAKAQAAGYTNKPLWKSDPEAMLIAAVTRRIVRFHCPEVAAGLNLDDDPVGEFSPAREEPPSRVHASAERVENAPDNTDAARPDPAADADPEPNSMIAQAKNVLADALKAKDVKTLTLLGRDASKKDLLDKVVSEDGDTLKEMLMKRMKELESASVPG